MGTALGDGMSCMRTHQNQGAVKGGSSVGRDLDEAVLAAVNQSINANQSGLVQTVTLSFACVDLPNMDTFTRTDGMIVFSKQMGNKWQRIGMTEVIMDNLNPSWVKSFDIQYNFEKREQFRIDLYDVDDTANIQNLNGHDYVGNLEFSVHEVVTQRDQTLERPLQNDKRTAGTSGTIKVTGETKQNTNQEEVMMQMRATFPSMGGMNFFLIHKQISGAVWKPIYKSEIQQARNGAYEWNLVSLLSADLSGDDVEREIKLDFYQSAKSGKHSHVGQVPITLAMLKEGQREHTITDKKQRPLSGDHKMTFTKLDIQKRHAFLDYVFGGCQIGLTIAVDFTASNGNPSSPQSLHYLDMQKNEYLNAIRSVGSILQYYDSDKQIPLLGFGAAIAPYSNQANHCFALNGNIFDPEVDGIEGVIEAYKNSINRVTLYGPTNFAPTLELVNEMTEKMNCTQQDQQYNILLIITDGIITDLQKTIDQIVYGSSLPLSIIIVGVGSADFSAMDELDADEKPLYSQRYRKQMGADIVQFVPFRDFQNNPMMLAKETLEEVPGQMLNYFRNKGIVPNPANEAQRRQLQQQLSQARSMGGRMPQEKDDFWSQKKEAFLQKLEQETNGGISLFNAQDWIERNGYCSLDDYIIKDNMQNPHYMNPLKPMVQQQPQMQQQVNYAYQPQANAPQQMMAAQQQQPQGWFMPQGQNIMQQPQQQQQQQRRY